MSLETAVNIAGDTVDLLDRRVTAEGWGELTTETKDSLFDTIFDELMFYVPPPVENQNVLQFPGMKNTM